LQSVRWWTMPSLMWKTFFAGCAKISESPNRNAFQPLPPAEHTPGRTSEQRPRSREFPHARHRSRESLPVIRAGEDANKVGWPATQRLERQTGRDLGGVHGIVVHSQAVADGRHAAILPQDRMTRT
jgi:hypothetical protein